jgi:MFS family permease
MPMGRGCIGSVRLRVALHRPPASHRRENAVSPPPSERRAPTPAHGARAAIAWYYTSVAAFMAPSGIQSVLLAYLLAIELQQPAERFGFTQMLGQLPALLLLMVGGWLADRVDARRVLIGIQALGMLMPLGLAAALALGRIGEGLVLAYALAWGVVSAFALPARDGMLNRVAGGAVQKVVTVAIGMQFGTQMLGQALAGQAGAWGPVGILIAQALLLALGVFAASRLPAQAPAAPQGPRPSPLREIGGGFAVLFADPTIRATFLLLVGMGVFFAGVMVVLIPLAIRDLHGGGSRDIAQGLIAFGLGTLTMIAVLIRRGGVATPGRALCVSQFGGCAALLPMALDIPQWGFNACVFAWGMGGGLAMSMSRTLLQENAPASHRSRVMAAFSVASIGGAPVGSLMMGLAIGALGARQAVLIPVAGVLAVTLGVMATHPIWRVRSAGR